MSSAGKKPCRKPPCRHATNSARAAASYLSTPTISPLPKQSHRAGKSRPSAARSTASGAPAPAAQPPGLAWRRPTIPCYSLLRRHPLPVRATRFPCSRRQGIRPQALQITVAFASARPRMGPIPARFPDKVPDRRELGSRRRLCVGRPDGPPTWRLMWRGAVPFVYKPRHIADETRAGPADSVSSRSIA